MTALDAQKPPPYHHGNLQHALVEAGTELARTGGPTAIVLREAARRVGVSPNAAYRHFAALPDLVEAVADQALSALARFMEAELARCHPSGNARTDSLAALMAVGRGYINFALAEPGLFATAFSCQHLKVEVVDGRPGPYELLQQTLDAMVKTGLLAAADRETAAMTAWAAVHGLSELLLGPMAGLAARERVPLIDAHLDLVGRGLITRR